MLYSVLRLRPISYSNRNTSAGDSYISQAVVSLLTLSTEEIVTHQPLSSHPSQVAIVGIGGAGNNLLSQAIDGGCSPRNCVAVNTDRGQLSESRAQNKVLLADSPETSSQLSRQRGAQGQLMAYRVAPFTGESDFTILLSGALCEHAHVCGSLQSSLSS